MTNITVKICSGTTCFIMGGNNTGEFSDFIKSKYGENVDIIGCNCLGQCSNSHSKAPFAIINDEVISEVTLEKLVCEIDKRLS